MIKNLLQSAEPREKLMSFDNENLKRAFDEWTVLLGERAVISGEGASKKYGQNEIAATRKFLAALKPKNVEEISAVVRIAAKYKIPLYPVSMGKNWGYGASTPVADNCVIVDLSGMDKIVEMDEELGLVTVQPGVTLKKLRDYLDQRKLRYLAPVHGAGPNASIIGNALERGYGVTPYVDHFGAVTSLEAVLPNGEIYRPALSANGGSAIDKAFKWGIGPYLDGIFTQGSYGIVTEMTIALAPIPEHVEVFIFSLKREKDLEKAVKAVQDVLKSVGSVTGSVNLMNSNRVLSMVEKYPFDSVEKGKIMSPELVEHLLKENYLSCWTIGGVIYGDKKILDATKDVIKKTISPLAKRKLFFSRRKINFIKRILNVLPDRLTRKVKKQISNLEETLNVAEGAPTEIALPLCYWKSGKRPHKGKEMNPAQDGCGVIWYSPLVPMKSDQVRTYVDTVKKICTEHQIEPLITLTSLSHRCFDSTVPLLFDPRDPDETERAKKCYLALYEAGKKQGFLPYRVGIDHMDLVTQSGSTFWDLVSRLKKTIDPHGIISPGRYCPPE
jgi:4-cresol dehydrogenase (hydroxylating)